MDSLDLKKILGQLDDHEQRILSLEGWIEKPQMEKDKNRKSQKENYSGPMGGVRLLFSNGFFKDKKDLNLVREELKKKGYIYSTKSIDSALRRSSNVKGSLVSLKESGKKVYVERK